MPGNNAGFIGWILGGTGAILLYSAVKNESPLSVVKSVLTDAPRIPIDPTTGNTSSGIGSTPTPTASGENSTLYQSGGLPRSIALMNGAATPVLVPIPSQPNLKLDISALAPFMMAQAKWGKPIRLTGAWRSREQQAAGYASDPDRFAPPGDSAHEYGIAVDVDTRYTNVTDPDFVKVMNDKGWVAAGKSGAMHFSYGIRA